MEEFNKKITELVENINRLKNDKIKAENELRWAENKLKGFDVLDQEATEKAKEIGYCKGGNEDRSVYLFLVDKVLKRFSGSFDKSGEPIMKTVYVGVCYSIERDVERSYSYPIPKPAHEVRKRYKEFYESGLKEFKKQKRKTVESKIRGFLKDIEL